MFEDTYPSKAADYLRDNDWDLQAAAAVYFASLEEGSNEETAPAPSGPRTLGGDYVPQPVPSATSSAPQRSQGGSKKKFATIGDLGGGHQGGHGHTDESDDDDDEDQDLFAGGEKSGLAVQNPDDIKRKLIEKAKR
jgi:UBX domain-containing protein 1